MNKDRKLYFKEWKARNPEKIEAYHLRYRLKNLDKMRISSARWRTKNKEQIRLYDKKYRQTSPAKYKKYRESANERGHSFELSFDEFVSIISTWKCHYCGTEGKVGIDRIVNQKGYLIDNVVPCCWPCNRLKSRMMNGDQFISLCTAVARNHMQL